MKHFKLLFVPLWCVGLGTISAQNDTTFMLDSVQIQAHALRHVESSSHLQSWNSEQLKAFAASSLDALLQQQSGVFVKSYGNGSLATSSIRGGSAGHTAVVWNGLPIQSPMLGQLDLSLMPASFVDELQLQYGGNAALWGSGAIGGTLLLNNQFRLQKGLGVQLQSQQGSFGWQDYQGKIYWSNGKIGLRSRVLYQQSDNDFTYRLRDDLPLRQQSHAYYQKEGFLQEVFWRPAPNQQFSLHLWGQQSLREIPPTTVQNRSEAEQEDRFLRLSLNWQKLNTRSTLKARAGLFRERLDYADPAIMLQSHSRFLTAIAEVERRDYFSERHQLISGVHYSWTQAVSDGYRDPVQQQRVAVFVSDQLQWKHWKLQLNLRQTWADGQFVPPVAGLSLERPVLKQWSVLAKVSRNYRLPTLNDRYWSPGGNPDLKAESGWGQEAGLRYHLELPRSQLQYRVFAYHRLIDNWILWSIQPDQNHWSAQNIAQVRSRGFEQRLEYSVQRQKHRLSLRLGYDYTRSTNLIALEAPKIEAGSQLIYTPVHQAFGGLNWRWKTFSLAYQHRYSGTVSTVGPDPLPAWQLGYLQLSQQWAFPHWDARLSFSMDNVWNTSYRTIERRVMPGRTLRLGLSLSWDRPKLTL